MSAYEDGFGSYHSTPPNNLNESERREWEQGKDAARVQAGAKMYFESVGGLERLVPSIIIIVIGMLIWLGCKELWEKIKHFVVFTDPTIKLPSTIVFCALSVYWLFKKSKLWGSLLLVISLSFLSFWTHAVIRNHRAQEEWNQRQRAAEGLHFEQFN